MAGVKTNSNSITAILINKLNYKKSGFRTEILKQWNLTDDLVFHDGTHSSVPGLGGTKPDIIGKIGEKICVIIEVKANLHEPLQESQKKNGRYEQFVNDSDRHLIYIVPDGYEHIDELPDANSQIHIFKWSKIYEIAKANDNTGFTEQIDYFVESQFHTNDLLLSNGDVAMFLSPSIIGKVNNLYLKIKRLMEGFVNSSGIKLKYEEDCELGWYYSFKDKTYRINNDGKEDVWIGLCEMKNSKYTFFMAPWNCSELENYMQEKDYFLEDQEKRYQVYIPITEENNEIPEFLCSETADDQQEKFNKLMSYNINKLLKMLGIKE